MTMNKERVQSAIAWCGLGSLLFFIYAAAVLKLIDVPIDYHTHLSLAQGITWEALRHPLDFLKTNCYPVWHVLTWLAMNVLGCKGRTAVAIVTSGCLVGTWACAAWFFSRKYRESGRDMVRAACTCLVLVMPIWLPFFNPNIVLGQGAPNLLHSPTNVMVKFLAFPCFMWYAAIMDGIGKDSAMRMGVFKLAVLSLLVFFATLSKPSFLQMFLPAMVLLSLIKLVQYRVAAIKPIAVVAASFVPVGLLIVWQAWLALYSPGSGGTGIGIAFLKVWSTGTPNVFVSMLLGTLFPLTVLLWSLTARKATTADALAWIMYVVAVSQAAFLVETGWRVWHANFFWAHNLALFFIWFTAIDRFISLAGESFKGTAGSMQKWWLVVTSVVLLLHLVSGFCYLWRVLVHGMWR